MTANPQLGAPTLVRELFDRGAPLPDAISLGTPALDLG
jgi:hypothetical protein